MASYLIQCTKCLTLIDPAVLFAQNINPKLKKCPICQASVKRIPKEPSQQQQQTHMKIQKSVKGMKLLEFFCC